MDFLVGTKNCKKRYVTIYMPIESLQILKSASTLTGVSLGNLIHLSVKKVLAEKSAAGRTVLSKSKVNGLKEEVVREALQMAVNE